MDSITLTAAQLEAIVRAAVSAALTAQAGQAQAQLEGQAASLAPVVVEPGQAGEDWLEAAFANMPPLEDIDLVALGEPLDLDLEGEADYRAGAWPGVDQAAGELALELLWRKLYGGAKPLELRQAVDRDAPLFDGGAERMRQQQHLI